jgi:hypothetical protein
MSGSQFHLQLVVIACLYFCLSLLSCGPKHELSRISSIPPTSRQAPPTIDFEEQPPPSEQGPAIRPELFAQDRVLCSGGKLSAGQLNLGNLSSTSASYPSAIRLYRSRDSMDGFQRDMSSDAIQIKYPMGISATGSRLQLAFSGKMKHDTSDSLYLADIDVTRRAGFAFAGSPLPEVSARLRRGYGEVGLAIPPPYAIDSFEGPRILFPLQQDDEWIVAAGLLPEFDLQSEFGNLRLDQFWHPRWLRSQKAFLLDMIGSPQDTFAQLYVDIDKSRFLNFPKLSADNHSLAAIEIGDTRLAWLERSSESTWLMLGSIVDNGIEIDKSFELKNLDIGNFHWKAHLDQLSLGDELSFLLARQNLEAPKQTELIAVKEKDSELVVQKIWSLPIKTSSFGTSKSEVLNIKSTKDLMSAVIIVDRGYRIVPYRLREDSLAPLNQSECQFSSVFTNQKRGEP